MIQVFSKRLAPYLTSGLSFHYVPWSMRVEDFGAGRSQDNGIVSASNMTDILGIGYTTREKRIRMLHPDIRYREPSPEPGSFTDNCFSHGHKHEVQAASAVLRRLNYDLWPLQSSEQQRSYTCVWREETSRDTVQTSATPDLMTVSLDKVMVPVELKCPYHKYISGAVADQDSIRPNHYVQVQYQLLVTGCPEAYLGIYVPGSNPSLALWTVDADPAFQEFLLMNVYIAQSEIRASDSKRYKVFPNEKAWNHSVVDESMRGHATFLINE